MRVGWDSNFSKRKDPRGNGLEGQTPWQNIKAGRQQQSHSDMTCSRPVNKPSISSRPGCLEIAGGPGQWHSRVLSQPLKSVLRRKPSKTPATYAAPSLQRATLTLTRQAVFLVMWFLDMSNIAPGMNLPPARPGHWTHQRSTSE